MLTFQSLCEAYLHHLEGRPSYRRYRGVYRLYFEQAWGGQLASEVTRLQIIRFSQQLIPLEQKRKALGLVRQAYRWASNTINPETNDLYFSGVNPATGLYLKKSPPRERLATLDELKLIIKELPRLFMRRPWHAGFFSVRLAAPCRIAELNVAQPRHWTRCEVIPGVKGAWWHKPTTKNGIPHTVYVAAQAMRYMELMDWDADYFFTGKEGGPISDVTAHSAWSRWMTELKIENLQLLDIRRALASYLYRMHRRQEVDDLTIKALLNHYDGRPVAVYTRLDVDALAKILQGYADWLWGLPGTVQEPVRRLERPAEWKSDELAVMEVPG